MSPWSLGTSLRGGFFFRTATGPRRCFVFWARPLRNTWAWAWTTVTWAAACARLGRGRGGEGRGSSAPKAPAPAQAAISGTESESPGLKSHPPGTRLVDSWRAAGSKQGSRQEQTVFKLTRLKSGLLPLCLLRHVSICGYRTYPQSIQLKKPPLLCAHILGFPARCLCPCPGHQSTPPVLAPSIFCRPPGSRRVASPLAHTTNATTGRL